MNVSKMNIDSHAFDRMAVRLTADEELEITLKIEKVWSTVDFCVDKDIGIIVMKLKDFRMTDNSTPYYLKFFHGSKGELTP